jgi:predicted MFS family arabinose efflux permease
MFDCSVMVMILPYLTLRQRLTPDEMLGRMISTMRTLTIATAPLGAFAGGWLGEHLTLRPALFVIAACALILVAAMIWLSPLRKASI